VVGGLYQVVQDGKLHHILLRHVQLLPLAVVNPLPLLRILWMKLRRLAGS
jgi:hypothetical protein